MLEAMLNSTLSMATPILLAALGELIVEQAGVINIGIEGAMLSGAFFALAGAYFSGSTLLGLGAGVGGAMAINAMFAFMAVNLAASQVVTGTALNIMAAGITGVCYRRFFGTTGKAFVVQPIANIALGPLAKIPIFGRAFFDHNPIVYFAFALVPIVGWALTRTHAGLSLRAVGERPLAADALGLGVVRLRWIALMISGALSGIAGAYLTLAYADTFVENISAGRGFVALSVVIVGRWSGWGIAAASMLFGGAIALQFGMQAMGTSVPYQLFLAMPYVLTLGVLAFARGQSAAPSALGEPYYRE